MQVVARMKASDRAEIFSETAAIRGMTPSVVEKDFWVTWVLGRLFEHDDLSRLLTFKGGTSLSKVYQLIERFSEDIDLVLNWNALEGEDPLASRSKSKQARVNDDINRHAAAYIAGPLLSMVKSVLEDVCVCGIDPEDCYVINIRYPAAFSSDYLRPEVRLEIGPLASWTPADKRTVRPYAAEVFPEVFKEPECTVRVILAERTFWEKVTILHHEAHRPEKSPQPPRYSRHYYDLAKMACSDYKSRALTMLDLLDQVVEFKQRFYPRSWAKYGLAKPGSLILLPAGHVLKSVTADYAAMRQMIFGSVPSFEVILSTLRDLESEINAMAVN